MAGGAHFAMHLLLVAAFFAACSAQPNNTNDNTTPSIPAVTPPPHFARLAPTQHTFLWNSVVGCALHELAVQHLLRNES